MADTATMRQDRVAHPKVREDDARGTPPGAGVVPGKPLHPGANPGKIGNPPFVPTVDQRRDVEAWVRAGLTRDDIGIMLDVSGSTVDRHFKRELQLGRAKLKVALGGKLVKMALEGDKTSLIFWLRTQAKWNTRVEHVGADGGPIKTFDLSQFPLDEKRLLLAVIDQLLAQHGEEAHGDQPGQPDQPTTTH